MSRVMRTHTGITEWNGDYWCDSCGKRVRGITIVNGMDFCAKCYQETFGETEKDRKITDLQSQLAEKEKIEYTDTIKFVETSEPNVVANELDRLNKQLAEKDKVILILEKQNKALSEEEDLLTEKLKELGVDCIEDLGKAQNQKALEQLTEIRDYVINCWSLDKLEGEVRLDIAKKIRLKIEQLKEGK